MSVSDVLGEAFDLYRRFFWRFVATAAVVFVVLDLASAFADRASGSSVGAELLWTLIALVLSVVGAFWLQGALIEAVRDVRDGRIDVRGYGWSVFGSLVVAFLLYVIAQGVLRAAFEPLPNFLATWIGGIVAHSVTTPFIAAVGAVMYFRLVRFAAAVEPVPQVPEA